MRGARRGEALVSSGTPLIRQIIEDVVVPETQRSKAKPRLVAERPDVAWRQIGRLLHSVTHPSSVSALRADPPSPTGGEGEEGTFPFIRNRSQTGETAEKPGLAGRSLNVDPSL